MATVVQDIETTWTGSTTPKTTAAFNVLAQDILVAFGIGSSYDGSNSLSISDSSGLTWEPVLSAFTSSCPIVSVWFTVVPVDTTGLTVSFARSATSITFGGTVITVRDAVARGTANGNAGTSTAPSVSLSTTANNSLVFVAVADATAAGGSSRTWQTTAGALTELTYFTNLVNYTGYVGYHADVGLIGSKSVGLTTPSPMSLAMIGFEVKQMLMSEPGALTYTKGRA